MVAPVEQVEDGLGRHKFDGKKVFASAVAGYRGVLSVLADRRGAEYFGRNAHRVVIIGVQKIRREFLVPSCSHDSHQQPTEFANCFPQPAWKNAPQAGIFGRYK